MGFAMALSTAEQSSKVITAYADLAPQPDIRPDLLLRLQGKLQTTLELNQLLDIFLSQIQQSVLVDGLTYQHKKTLKTLQLGRKSRHNVHYHLQTQDEDMGVLSFQRSTRFQEQELANLEGLLTSLVYPLRNAVLYHQALSAAAKDPLTGAGNRYAMETYVPREIELSKRHKQNMVILMLDIDHFKLVNDYYGHCTGDKVLASVVASINQSVRQTDMCFRFGGEEFLIMLSSTDMEGALRLAERIRQNIADLRFMTDKGTMQITASIGCAALQANDKLEDLVERADKALYQAKRHGRNKVICATPDPILQQA